MLYRTAEKHYEYIEFQNKYLFREVVFEHLTIGLIDNALDQNYSIHFRIVDENVFNYYNETKTLDMEKIDLESRGKYIRVIDKIPGSPFLEEDLNYIKQKTYSQFEKDKMIQEAKDQIRVKPIFRFILQFNDEKLYKVYEGYYRKYKGVVTEQEMLDMDKSLYSFKLIKDELVTTPFILKINDEFLPFFSLKELDTVYVTKNGSLHSKELLSNKQKVYIRMRKEAMELLHTH